MNSHKPLLLGQRASSKSKKLAPIDQQAIKNKDLLIVEMAETAGGTFSDGMHKDGNEVITKAFNSQTNFVKKNQSKPTVRSIRNLPALDPTKTKNVETEPKIAEQRQRGSSMGNPQRVKDKQQSVKRNSSQLGLKENQISAPKAMEPILEYQPKVINKKTDKQVAIEKKTKRERPLNFQNQSKELPQKWLKALQKQNYISFAERLETIYIKKKIQALKNMKKEWKRRINLFIAYYRRRKYGEEIQEAKQEDDLWGNSKEQKIVEMKLKMLDRGAKQAHDAIDKLIGSTKTVLLPVDEEQESEVFEQKSEVRDFCLSSILEDFVMQHTRHIAWQTLTVKNWLLMCVVRRRFLKKLNSCIRIQAQIRSYLACKQVKRLRLNLIEKSRVKQLEQYIAKSKKGNSLHSAATLIQNEIYRKRIVRCRQAREIRQKLKALPYVCRAGFIKMNCLKQDTMALNKTATRLFSAKGGRQK